MVLISDYMMFEMTATRGVLKMMMGTESAINEFLCFICRRINGSDCSERDVISENLIIRRKKELRFRKGRLINKKTLISVNQLVEQFTNNSILVSLYSRGFSKSNVFYYIDQRLEHISSEESSSSEYG
jgi:hypothetical protein